ncbi:hypothetical protein ACHWQZ_G017946 [Mnemiopsis leidyi]
MGEDPQPSHSFEALVSHVIDIDKFWVQPLYNNEDRKKLAVIESALGSSAKPFTDKTPKADDYVSVKLNERGWKRARLQQDIHHSLAYIKLVDYGSDEQVPESSLYSLPYELGIEVLQEQSMMCALAGVKPIPTRPPQSVNYFRDILMNRKVTVKCYSISPTTSDLLVDIVTPEYPSVRQNILLHQLASMTIVPTAPYTKDPGTIQPKIGEKNAVIVSHISDLTDFYVQYRATEKNISSMMTAMKSMYSANVHSPASMINLGMLCCVQLGSDWFRAEIKQVLSNGYILVILKDFGNVQLVTSKAIYPLEGSLISTPFWAVRCGLNNIAPTTPTVIGNFPRQLTQWFHKYATDTNAYHIAHFIRQADERYYIELQDEQGGGEAKPTTTELLITNKCAKRVADNFPAYTGMQAQLNQMGSDMMSSLNQNTQQYSSANSALNGHAQAHTNMSSHGMTSQAAAQGYGASNFNAMASIANANPSFLANAASYMQSAPAAYTAAAQPSAAYTASQQGSYGVQQATSHYTAQHSQQSAPVARAPRSRGESKVPSDVFEGSYPEPQLARMEEVTVEITTDPLNFVCLLKKYFEQVDQANNQIMKIYSGGRDYSIPSSKLRRGMPCVAPYVDVEGGVEQYYRAKILNIDRNEAEVLFVDYGNVNIVQLSGLKYLPQTCATVPQSYIKCEFDNVHPTDVGGWSDGSLRAFEDYLANGEFVAAFGGVNKSGDGYIVELFPLEPGRNSSDFLNNPVSVELERRGVLKKGEQIVSAASSRGRRTHASRDHEVSRQSSRDDDYRGRGARDEVDRGTRSRGRDMSDRTSSPSGSIANTELIRANFKPPTIAKKGYIDVKVFQPNTPSKFSCQILTNREELEELTRKMSQVYDRGDEMDYMEDSDIMPYAACAVLLDTTWQRGYVLSSSSHGCQVVMVDTQEVRSVDPDQLRFLRDQFQKLPAQGVKCSLDAIQCKSGKWNSESCRYFKELVTENEFIAEFRTERGGSWRIMLHSNVNGADQLVNAMFVVKGWASSTDLAVREAVEDLNAARANPFQMQHVDIGKSMMVSPSHSEGPNEFYVQLITSRQQIEDLSEKIYEYYSTHGSDKAKLHVDNYCAAMWDEGWYRGRIVSVARNECEVYFVDYGNTDLVENTHIRGLTKQFKQEPMYAIKCRLEGIDPTMMEQMTNIFIDLVNPESEDELVFHATFIKQDKEGYLVSLYQDNIPLLQKMFQIMYSNPGAGAVTPSRAARSSRESAARDHPSLALPRKDSVQISHARDPTLLYLHCEREGETEKTINKICALLEQCVARGMNPLRMRQVGSLCAVQFEEDQQWYRGQIVAVHGDQNQVRFIDYGNEENKRGSEIFELDRQLSEIPAQTCPCQLAGIAEPPAGWADASREMNICEDEQFSLTVVDPQTNPPTVELYHGKTGISLAMELISMGFGIDTTKQCIAMSQTPQIDGGTFQAKVAYADYPGRLYIQKVAEFERLEDLLEALAEEYGEAAKSGNLPRLGVEPKIGTICCAQYSDDEQFYRAQIYGITRSSIKIQFMDFGNVEDKTASQLYQLKDEFTKLPSQAIECALHGCTITTTEWNTSMQEFFEETVMDKTYNCSILSRLQDGFMVKLEDMKTGQDLSEVVNRFIQSGGTITSAQQPNNNNNNVFETAAQPAPTPAPASNRDEAVKIDWPPRIDKFDHVDAMISFGEGPEDFWVNLVDNDDKLGQLDAKMQQVYASGGSSVPRVFRYMYIAAKSPEDGRVYRAKTLNNDRDMPQLVYVDYGNEEEVPRDNLYLLEPYLATVLPCQAVHCALNEVDRLKPEGSIRPELLAKFEELVSEQIIQIKNISPAQREKPHNEIEILLRGENVLELLEKELVALSGPPDVPVCTAQIGSVLKGMLVNISSTSDFWIQLAGPISKINDSTKVCTDKMTEKPDVDTYCAVVLGDEDDTVYRARVVSVDGDNVTVLCIDYGYTHSLPMKNVYKLKQKCGEEPAQAFPCSLPLSVPEEKETVVMEILNQLSEKCVTVKLYSKDNDRFTVDFHPSDHVTVFTPHASSTLPSLVEVSGVYQLQKIDPEQTYFVSHSTDLSQFYVQRSDLDADELAKTVSDACAASPPPVPLPTRGTVCVAKDSEFGAWNRAIVTDILEGDMVNLLYLDYGSGEAVKKSAVRTLPESLHSLPVAAVKCSISPLPEDYLNFTELFSTVTADRELTLTPSEDGGVSVTVDGSSLTEVFQKATHYSTLTFSRPELQETSNVYCTSVEDPFNIWVQLAEYAEELEKVMADLATYSPDAPALYTHTPGTVCAALFPADEVWYRAEITNQGPEKCTVKFVDYGNCCEVEKANLKLLPEEHLTMPANSVLVRLAHVRPKSGTKWDDAAVDKLFELTTEVLCEMKLTSVRALQHVSLSVEGVDVAASMAEVASPTPDPDILHIPQLSLEGGEKTISITHVEQVDKIYGILAENADATYALSDLSEGLVTVDQLFTPLQCIAKFSADGVLYRANIVSFTETEAEVWFVDFGNRDRVKMSDLWYLKPEHVELPAQAIPLKLDGVKPVTGTEWTEAAKTALNEQINCVEVTVTLPDLENITVSSESSVVDISVEGVSAAESLKSSKNARSLIQPPVVTHYPPHQLANEVSVYCTEVEVKEDSVNVTCQFAGEKVDEIQALLQEKITEGHPDYTPEKITLGLVCTTRFSADNAWYRAEVTDVEGDKVTVKFVDYGNSETKRSGDIQLLPEDLNTPTQMITVKLAGTDRMSGVDKMFLRKMMVLDSELVMKKPSGEDASFFLVTLNEEGEEVERLDLVEKTLAHSAAVGSYPNFPVITSDSVVYSCQIDSPDEIYVQQAESEEILETIGTQLVEHEPNKTVNSAPFLGQPVLAVFEGALYRAVVLEVMTGSNYRVQFVDYANSSVVKEVYDITPEQIAHPPQAIRTSIQQYTPVPDKPVTETTTFLKTLLTEKEISVVECPETETALSGTVEVSYSVEGKNVRLSLLQQGLCVDADTTVGEYKHTNIPAKPVEVAVTHVQDENHFFASRTGGEVVELDEDEPVPEADPTDTEDLVEVDTYLGDMQAVLDDESGRPPVLDTVQVGTLCVTRWEGELYRAVVLWITHDYAKVRFIDYGNTYYTPLTEILDCPEPYRGPGLAVPFIGQIDEKPVADAGLYLVEKSGVVDEGAGWTNVTIAPPLPKIHKFKYTKPDLNTPFTGYVSQPLQHGHFFVQQEEATEVLETTLPPLIDTAVSAKTPVPYLVPGAPVLGLFQGAYYRGKIIDVVKEGVAKVLFVDYGNTEICTNMYDVTPELMAVRVVGINCQLDGVNWVGVEAKAIYDEHIVSDSELTITPLSYNKDLKQFSVSVSVGEEETDLGETLNTATVAVSDKKIPTAETNFPSNTYITLYCSKLNSVQDVCLQQEEDFELLETIGAECAGAPKVQLLSAEPETYCLGLDPNDGAYYRCKITSVADNKYSVHYVDYGNRETLPLTSLFDIPLSLTAHKICGIYCRLNGTQTPNITKLQQLCDPNTPLPVSFSPRSEGEVLTVDIMLGTSTLRSHVQEDALVDLPEKYLTPKFEEATTLLISVTNSPADFYGQRAENGGRLGVLGELISKLTDQTENLADPQPGLPCVARLSDDGELYRATVLSSSEEGVSVLYVDFGNSEEVPLTSLYKLPNILLSIPLLAVPLSLSSISTPDTWSEESVNLITELLYPDCEMLVTPVSWSEDGRCLAVVEVDGKCVKSLMGELVENTDPDWTPRDTPAEPSPAAETPAEETPAADSPAADTPHFQYQKLEAGPSVVLVSHREGPSDFSLQKAEWSEDLDKVYNQVQEAETALLANPTPGTICIALSVELGDKYRAEVVEVAHPSVTVRYVDYGNQETVPAENLTTVPESLITVPVLAVPCTLPGTWAQPAVEKFNELIQSDFEVTVTPINWSEEERLTCTCKLECNGADIATSI